MQNYPGKMKSVLINNLFLILVDIHITIIKQKKFINILSLKKYFLVFGNCLSITN